MKRLLIALASSLLLAACADSQHGAEPPKAPPAGNDPAAKAGDPPAVPHKGSSVELPSSDKKALGYLSLPAAGGAPKKAAIIVIQEWWGMNDWIKENADRLAAQGYVALAVDLYRGADAKDAGTAHELMRGLSEDRAIGDLEAGFNYLATRPDVDPAKIGAVGWCMGGGYTLALAVNEPRLKAAAMNYGKIVQDPDKISKVKAALLGNFAGKDKGIAPADVRTFEGAMRGAGKDVDIKIYDPDGHAFMNPNNKEGYDAAAAQDAWARIDTFFAKKLK